MNKLADTSIRNKLRMLLSMSILFMLLVAGGILMVNAFLSNRSVLSHEANALAEVTALAITPSLIFDNKQDAQQTLDTLKAHDSIVYAVVLNSNQQPFAIYQREVDWQLTNDKAVILQSCPQYKFTINSLNVCKSLVFDKVNYGKFLIVISLDNVYQRLFKELFFAFLGLLIAAWLIFFILERFAKKLTAPILELLTISEGVSKSGEYDKRATIQSQDEIGRLGQAFNIMLEKIQSWNEILIKQNYKLEELVEERTQEKNTALILAEQAQKANVAKSEFLSVMSHEIRTPLNAVLGFSEMLKNTRLDKQQKQFTDNIIQSGNSLLSQINDILDFSKIESGKMEQDPTWFDIYELLITVLAGNLYESKRKSLQLKHQVDTDLPRYLYGDEQKIKQILYNLMNNAIKFTEFGYVSLKVKTEQTTEESCVVVFSIEDTGIGIAKNKQDILFDAFTQADASTTRKYGGTGLGLAIVKKLVALLNGNISLQSIPGQGTTFLLQIPLALKIPEPENFQFKPHFIGLFEDKDDSALALKLKQLGYTVESIDSSTCQLLTQKNNIAHKYQLLIFSEPYLDNALLWEQQDHQSDQKTPIAYYVENGDRVKNISDIPSIKIEQDMLKMVEQINKLINGNSYDNKPKTLTGEFKVLVVEDNLVNLLMTQQMLEQADMKVLSATNGQQAIDIFIDNEVSLILMDYQMPVMDGLTATREIRKIEIKKSVHTPIIGLTANAFKVDREACFAAGMDDFLSKPFRQQQLLDIVGWWLKKDVKSQSSTHSDKESPAQSTLDANIIKELIALDENYTTEFLSQISANFFTITDQLLQQIETAFSEKEMATIAKCAHQLKSSCMHLGAKKLSDLFKQLELLSMQDNYQESIKICESIDIEFQLVKKAYKSLLND